VIAPPSAAPEAADGGAWRRADVLAGLPQIYPETAGRFVPQMLNLHWLDGIDFHKGCYPGQEVVARLQYRGRLTRRLFRGVLDAADTPAPGAPVTDAEGSVQGEVVDAAPGPEGQDLLAVLRIAQRRCAPTEEGAEADGGALRIGGAELILAPLPYPTKDPNPA
jgi:folate-binding protein YgfZ